MLHNLDLDIHLFTYLSIISWSAVRRLAVVVSTEDCCEDPHELWGIFFPVHPVATGMRIVTEITEMIYNSAERSRAPEVPRVLF